MKHLVVIDGLSFLFRAYHAVRPLTRSSDGLHTNALYGFAQMLIKVVRDLDPDMCCVALDSRGPTFRDEMYEAYKANRSEMDAEMAEQMPYFEPMIEAFGIQGIRIEGVEADDIIATLATQYGKDHKVTIVSSDKDLMQLLGGNVVMLDTMKSITHGPETVNEKFGVGPDKVIEVQALIGDSSDNIPGVRGIGPKTAAQLIGKYDTLEGIYDHLDDIPQPKLRENLGNSKDVAFLSRQLVTLKRDVDLGSLQLHYEPTPERAKDLLLELEFKTLADRLEGNGNGRSGEAGKQGLTKPTAAKAEYEAVTTEKQLEDWAQAVRKAKVVAFDTETTSLDPMVAELVGLSLCVEPGKACYIPLSHKGDMLGGPEQLEKKKVLKVVGDLLADPTITIIGHNLKYDWLIMENEDVHITSYEDTMLMSFCLYGGMHNHGLDDLSRRYLDHSPIPYSAVCGTGAKQITFDQVQIEQATDYAAEDADMTLRLYRLFEPQLKELAGPQAVYTTIERPLMPVVAAMERLGVKVSKDELAKLSTDFAKRMEQHQKKVYALAGEEFNLNSPKQLADILYGKMGLAGGRKTKTGWSTNEEALSRLAEEGHEIAGEMLVYRGLAKLKSTYSDALVKQINPNTGRVHTSYNQTGAATGRFSSSDPNLQNIPIRNEDGRKIRHAFIPEKGYVLMSADYSQIELRLLAHMGNVEPLQAAFNDGVDIHRHTASKMFDVAPEDVTDEQRRAAKVINFGIVYGMGPFSLSKQLGVSQATAKEYIENYFKRYQGIRDYLDQMVEFAKKHGYVETLKGRRVHVPNINAKNRGLAAGAERAAINAPLQGSNADIIKLAMIELAKELETTPHTRMLMQVHDELVFEVEKGKEDAAKALVVSVMQNIVQLKVPLTVGVGFGETWEDAH